LSLGTIQFGNNGFIKVFDLRMVWIGEPFLNETLEHLGAQQLLQKIAGAVR